MSIVLTVVLSINVSPFDVWWWLVILASSMQNFLCSDHLPNFQSSSYHLCPLYYHYDNWMLVKVECLGRNSDISGWVRRSCDTYGHCQSILQAWCRSVLLEKGRSMSGVGYQSIKSWSSIDVSELSPTPQYQATTNLGLPSISRWGVFGLTTLTGS